MITVSTDEWRQYTIESLENAERETTLAFDTPDGFAQIYMSEEQVKELIRNLADTIGLSAFASWSNLSTGA